MDVCETDTTLIDEVAAYLDRARNSLSVAQSRYYHDHADAWILVLVTKAADRGPKSEDSFRAAASELAAGLTAAETPPEREDQTIGSGLKSLNEQCNARSRKPSRRTWTSFNRL